MNYALETDGLTKRYGDVAAVTGVSLRVAPGEIYGFLGLNGAGKTTTIRLLLGMIRPTAGAIRLLGTPVAGSAGPWARVGHLVEQPAVYPDLTAREHLEMNRRLYGVADRGAVDAALETFRLGAYADRRAGTLSLGNLQRLGLARALLHRPALALLDEPTNGLDPAGVVEVREYLRGLARDHGVTLFMSSHLLAEVDRLATRIGVIHEGRLVEELSATELEARRARRLVVDARDRAAARAALEAAGYAPAEDAHGLALIEPRALTAPDAVARVLVEAGAPPTHLVVAQEDLEAHFLRLIGAAP